MKKTSTGVNFLEMDSSNNFKNVLEKKINSLKTLIKHPDKRIIVYWMRHCQSCANIKYKLDPSRHLSTPACTQKGLSMSLAIGQELLQKNVSFDQVMCSPLPRAMMTAYFVCKTLGHTDITVIPHISEKTSIVNNHAPYGTETSNAVSFKECKNWVSALNSLKKGPSVEIDINEKELRKAYNGYNKKNFVIKGNIHKDYLKFLKNVLIDTGDADESNVLIVSHQHYIKNIGKPFGLSGKIQNNRIVKVEYNIRNDIIVATDFEYNEYKDLKTKDIHDYYGDKFLKKLKIVDCKHLYSNSSNMEINKNNKYRKRKLKTLSKMSNIINYLNL